MSKKFLIIASGLITLIIIGIIAIVFSIQRDDEQNEKNTLIKLDSRLGNDIYCLDYKTEEIYDMELHQKIEKEISNTLDKKHKFNHPLIIYNAYGTNQLSLNIYFYNRKNTNISYTITTENTEYSKKAYEKKVKNIHAFQIIGLIAGTTNNITIKDTVTSEEYKFSIHVPAINLPQISIVEDYSKDNLEDGLYALLGVLTDSGTIDNLYLSDNTGTIRGVIPLLHNVYMEENNTADNILFYDNGMLYNVKKNEIAKINSLGKLEKLYTWPERYEKHHDFAIDQAKEKMLILVDDTESNTIEDIVLIYDLKKEAVEKIIDLKNLLADLYQKSDHNYLSEYYDNKLDWIHINSIDIHNDEILLSSRELSSIIAIKNIYNEPELNYIIGEESMFEDTYKEYIYKTNDKTSLPLGQHTAYFLFKDNQKYISFFNNNYGVSSVTNWYNWNTAKNEKREEMSSYCLYKIDDKKKEFILENKIYVPYSPFMSSAQEIGNGNKVISSRTEKYFAEYDKTGNLLKSFQLNRFAYRVNKYDFNEFWFRK